MLTRAAGHLMMAGIAILIQDLLARAGRGPERWLVPRVGRQPARWAVGWFLGLATYGTALLGLAATGLFTRVTVIGLLPLLILIARRGPRACSPLSAAVRAIRAQSWLALGAVILPLVPILARLLSPHLDYDSMIYHLNFPAQCLINHRVSLEHVTWSFHFPLLADLTHALPIALGDDRLGKWTALTALLAATAIAARRSPGYGWLFLLVALSPRSLTWLAGLTKNDLAAAGLLTAGAVLWRDGPRSAAAVLLGASIAAKPTGAPLVLVWTAIHAHLPIRQSGENGQRRSAMSGILSFRSMLLLCLFSAPLLPWLVKSWIATGDPAHPHLWKILPGPFWGPAHQITLEAQHIWIDDAGRAATLPLAWFRSMAQDFPLQLIALPLIALTGRHRAVLAAGLGAAAVLFTGRISRYMIPAAWLVSYELAAAAIAISGRRGRSLCGALAAISLAFMASWPEMRKVPWKAFSEPVAAARRASLGGVMDMAEALAHRGTARVLLTGANPSYPLPARILYDGFNGERPVVHNLVAASRDAERVRVGFRQLGATALLHNFVSVDWTATFYHSFPWTDRMLRNYASFTRGRLTPLAGPRRADRELGGHWLLHIDTGPGHRRPAPVYFLPGSEVSMLGARHFRDRADHPAAEREWRRLRGVIPGVAAVASQLGQTLAEAGRWLEAYRVFAPLTESGYIDGANLWGHGTAAIYAGRYDEAESALRRAIEIYDTKEANRTNLAWCYQARADSLIRKGERHEAAQWLAKAEQTLANVPATPGTYWATARRQIAALVIGSRADLASRAGKPADASRLYGQAAALGHDLPEAKRWSEATR